MMPAATHQIVLTTCPDAETAERLARALVDEGLAACVNVVPAMHSVYRWRGRTETATEHLLLVKSTAAAYGAIEARIRALHPYELPEIVAVPVTKGFSDYLAWLNHPDETA